MKQSIRGRRWALLLVALAMVAAACGGDEAADPADPDAPEDAAEAEGGGEYSTYIGEPEALFPSNTNETSGGEVLNALFSGLAEYDPETNEALFGEDGTRAHAESVESDDQQNWTITLKEGWTFHNGDPVTAQDYVDTWNYAAFQPNAQGNAYFFANVAGYDDLQCAEVDEDDACIGEPAAMEMTGLSAPDETTIEVELTEPFSQYPLTVGYTAFFAVPAECLEDPDACNEAPIGNGPFQIDGTWNHNENVMVTRFEDYAGEPAVADAVEFRIYSEIDTAYNDLLAGSLDILEEVPAAQIAAAQTEFGDRYLEGESSSYTYVGFPTYDERFADPMLRTAFSKAIDREAITETIRTDSVPADAFFSPTVQGYTEGACGTACEFDPEAAAQMLEEAGGWEGPLELWFNSGADHDAWMEAVANQLRENLGIEPITFQQLDFAEYLALADGQMFTGPYRLGWVMDYPSPQNYLENLYASDGSSNNTGYSNEEFDALIAEGNAAESAEAGIESYQAAAEILAEDVPVIPMFFGRTAGAHSENVSNVVLDAFTSLNSADIEVAQ